MASAELLVAAGAGRQVLLVCSSIAPRAHVPWPLRQSLMLGFMTNEKTITWEFLLAIFVANFPEAPGVALVVRAAPSHARCRVWEVAVSR